MNWQLFDRDKIEIEYNNVSCLIENDMLIFEEINDVINTIDFNNKCYIRKNNEFEFKINFNDKKFTYLLLKENLCMEDNIDCSFEYEDNVIKLIYKIDEEKTLLVHII